MANIIPSIPNTFTNGTVADATLVNANFTAIMNDVNTNASPVAGSTAIVTVGTIATGVWNGTPIGTAYGGSGATTAQASMDVFAGAVTSGYYLRGNGTNVVMAAIQAADVPTLNQNTTGNAATVTTNANLTGPVTSVGNATTITPTITAGGPIGSATATPVITYNAAGQLTAVSSATVTPAVGSITGLGTGIATALAVNTGSAGAPVLFNGAGGTPSAIVLTNATGTAAGLTAGEATNIAAGAANDLVIQTAAGTTGFATVGSGLTLSGGVLAATAGGGGTVTSVSVVSANGLAGTVATATTTPAITLSTTVTGIAKGDGTALSAATAGTDYSAGTSALGTGIVKTTTGTGALTVAVAADFPTLNQNTTGNAATATTASGLTSATTTVVVSAATAPTAGQVLTATSSTAADWATPSGGGALTLISTLTASNSASLSWTGLSGYSSYVVIGRGLVPSGNYVYAMLRFGTGGVPTWITSGYASAGAYVNGSTVSGISGGATGFSLDLQQGPTEISGVPAQDFVATVFNINSPSLYKGITWQTDLPLTPSGCPMVGASGMCSLTTQVTAIQIIAENVGTFVSGTVSLYGISS